jgi:PhzF family phenazine biosynthesis protein
MKLTLYKVDAFTDKLFSGNPAAVCQLDRWLSPELMKSIAIENSLTTTAFFIKEGNGYNIRWFTPTIELDLNGNATIATAHVLMNHLGYTGNEINFNSRSGMLTVKKQDGYYILNLPADEYEREKTPAELSISLNIRTGECYKGKADYMLIYPNEQDILKLKPNFRVMSLVDSRGVIVTAPGAPGSNIDFVLRFFAPQNAIDEDSVTGSAFATLIPYWAEKLNKKEMNAKQLSARRGFVKCHSLGNRVEISGKAKTYLQGEIEMDW